jgi:hypothetical protein
MSVDREDKAGQAFERYVADAYRALGYQVIRDTQVAGRQTDLIAKQEVLGAPTIKLAVECKDYKRPVGVSLVNEFASSVVAQCAAGEITGGALVSKSGFSPQARAAAEHQKDVTLVSLEDLTSKIVNVRHQLHQRVESYEKEEIFKDYLSLKVEALQWSTMIATEVREDFEPLLQRLIKFDGEIGTGAMFVLADFGAGKTTLLRNIEYHRAKAHLESKDTRVPLFVSLRDFRDSQDVETLLRASFRDAYYRDLPSALLWQQIESGGFYLLLDGFDEMVDRSDARRRLELFHELVPLFRSRSPVILTSRPSYLVERGELETLIKEIGAEEASIPSPVVGGPHSKVVVEQLRRQLFEQVRESSRRRGIDQALNASRVGVVRLQPLDREQVEAFIGRRGDQLAEVGATADDLLAFIDRTYDLTDLATRPMLLRLIVETVVSGGLDLTDTSTNYGASGLYDVYTCTKLDLDIDKVRGRDGALDTQARRQLAESIALEMYRTKSLELDFHETWERLAEEEGPLASALARSRLTQGEIATDLAARSFLTVDQDGICRFIHKSFRGFFIARILKEQLPAIDEMFEEPLEREVLYFLGGFDPTEPRVGEALWSVYKRTPQQKIALRRNLVVALLYTRPDHSDRKIEDTEIFEAEFGRLQFSNFHMRDVTWRDVTANRFDLAKSQWRDVRLHGVHLGHVLTESSGMDISMSGTVLESWECEGTRCRVTAVESTIETWDCERAVVECTGDGLFVERMLLKDADVLCGVSGASEFTLLAVRATDSRLRMSGDIASVELAATNSVIAYGSERNIDGNWNLKGCVLALSKGPAEQSTLVGTGRKTGLRADRGSIILAPEGISHSLLTTEAGVFGSVAAASDKRPIRFHPGVWGVLEAEEVLHRIGLPETDPGCKLGRLLLVRKSWYLEQIVQPKRRRAVVPELEVMLAEPDLDFADPETAGLFADLRRTLRNQHDTLLKKDWVEFENYVDDESSPLPS